MVKRPSVYNCKRWCVDVKESPPATEGPYQVMGNQEGLEIHYVGLYRCNSIHSDLNEPIVQLE